LALLFVCETLPEFFPSLKAVKNGFAMIMAENVAMTLTLVLIGLSREKIEDEFISDLRSSTLTAIIWIAFCLMAIKDVTTAVWSGLPQDNRDASLEIIKPFYEYGRYINLFNVGLLYIIVFRIRIWITCLISRGNDE